jgi:hypothetical protein
MNYITALTFIPPPDKFDIDSRSRQSQLRLLDVNLHTAMSQEERTGVVNQNSHGAGDMACLSIEAR